MNAIRLIALTSSLLLAAQAFADRPGFGDTWTIMLGGMNQTANVEVSSTRTGRPDINLDLDDLGMDDNATTFRAGVNWQFADKWGTSLTYSSFSTDGRETASESGNFGDIEWEADATLSSDYDLDLYIWNLNWNFVNTERTNFGVAAGLHIADISMAIAFEATAIINGQEVVVDSGSESTSLTAPLPNIGLQIGHRFGENLYLSGRAGYFTLKVDDVDGELVTAQAGLEWRPAKHFGVGIGYQYLTIDFDEKESDRKNTLEIDSHGPVLFLALGF